MNRSDSGISGGSPLGRSRKAAQRAETRRCPRCDRKSALKTTVQYGQAVTYCRYEDCGYESVTEIGDLL